MPSRTTAQRYMNGSITIGQQLKEMSDDVMQDTLYNDIQTRKCYLYDIYHDNRPNACFGIDGYDEDDCMKYPVECKFIVKTYKSVVKDDPEYHIMFSPEEWNTQSCVPDWWKFDNTKINYEQLGIRFPIGLYIDIPDDRGIYNRWLIVYDEPANQFPKFGVLRCNHKLQWVTNSRNIRYVREQWCVEKTQNSYNSGIYTYQKFTVEENQGKIWLPWNYISAELYYNQRIVLSMPIAEPLTWKISKVENTIPRGVQYITLYQDRFNQHTDKIWRPDDEDNPLPGQYTMLADYYELPDSPIANIDDIQPADLSLKLTCGSNQIYIGGSKVITVGCFNGDNDITSDITCTWSYTIDDVDVSSLIRETAQDEHNKIKITFVGDEDYVFKTLVVKCVASCSDGDAEANLQLGIIL